MEDPEELSLPKQATCASNKTQYGRIVHSQTQGLQHTQEINDI